MKEEKREKTIMMLLFIAGNLSFIVSGMFLYTKTIIPCFIAAALGFYLQRVALGDE